MRYSKDIESVEIPEGVEEIGESAFKDYKNLRSVKLPTTLKKIGKWAFNSCESLDSIAIPEGVKVIREATFCGCSNLRSVKLPTRLKKIGWMAFSVCSSLESIEIPEGVEEIGEGAFSSCSNLRSVKLPTRLKKIGGEAFSNCSSLESIEIPEGVEEIESWAFYGCLNLRSVKLPTTLKKIGKDAFLGCSSLDSIAIPEGVKAIGGSTFYDCSNLRSVKLPTTLKKIGEWAFKKCASLDSIAIPEGVKAIGELTFCGCSTLRSVKLPTTLKKIGEWAFKKCASLDSIEIPEGLEELGGEAFSECPNLRSVKLPTTLQRIGENTFAGCPFQLDEQTLPSGVVKLARQAGARRVLTVDGIEYAFRWCPPGEFMMGSPEDEPERDDDEKQHRVRLTQGFWLLETEVTQEMWESVMGTTLEEQNLKSEYQGIVGVGPKYPRYHVSWNESQEFCRKLGQKLNREIKLPTEAQWEYACRAGSIGPYAGTGDLASMGWYWDNSGSKTHEVGRKNSNAWGLYDMHGNVCEWCSDYFDDDYYAESPTSDPENRTPSPSRVFRGGCWRYCAGYCRSAVRDGSVPDYRDSDLGLRVLLVPSLEDNDSVETAPVAEKVAPVEVVPVEVPVEAVVPAQPLPASPKAGDRAVLTVDGVEYAFRYCPPGEFMMGSPEDEEGRKANEKQHRVSLTKGFWLLETEVTQEMWESVMGATVEEQAQKMLLDDTEYNFGSKSKTCRSILSVSRDRPARDVLSGVGPDRPIYYVNWNESMEFCQKLSVKLGYEIKLPTEAQWEYACRAGSTTALPNGPMELDDKGNAPALDLIAWYGGNSSQGFIGSVYVETSGSNDGSFGVQPVGRKEPNAWGLRDMLGNVSEWCLDFWDSDYYDQSPRNDPHNRFFSFNCVNRGGGIGYLSPASGCRSAYRNGLEPEFRSFFLGLRVLLVDESEEVESIESAVTAESAPTQSIPTSPKAGDRAVLTAGGIEYAFRYCPPGRFMMGSPEDEEGRMDDEKQHEVVLTQGFWILETQVTQEMWASAMGEKNSTQLKNARNPVKEVSWYECQEFCRKLGRKMGLELKLPTEAQWEYSCRAGTTGKYAGELDSMAWHNDKKLHEVGQKSPNAWGLYDMHGNLFEWCSDYGDKKYYDKSPTKDPENTTPSANHVVRGGDSVESSRSAFRAFLPSGALFANLGCRVLFVPQSEENKLVESAVAVEPAPTQSLPASPKAGDRAVLTADGIKYAFRYCPPGEFMMGDDEHWTKHRVALTKGFWLLETPVTQKMWKSVMCGNPSHFQGDWNPVDSVGWDQSQEFCRHLSRRLNRKLQLPTEAQWEYACRAGSTGTCAGTGELDSMGWHRDNSESTTHEVGLKKPNAWGFYDMHGNVWEWCADYYDEDYYDNSPANDPENTTPSTCRVSRGGSWIDKAENCQSVSRTWDPPCGQPFMSGLRVLLVDESEDGEAVEPAPVAEKVAPVEVVPVEVPVEAVVPVQPLPASPKAGDRAVLTADGIKYAFRYCPPGEFMMGSPKDEEWRDDDEQQHHVTLTQGFWLLETEVTQEMWESVMGENPSYFNGARNPVERVSWNDSQEFCRKLGQKLNREIKLPTEAQWEYACRAGSTGAYAGDLDSMGWYNDNSGWETHEVGQKSPNAWGLYDMLGNVWEWCSDYYDFDYYAESPTSDPENTSSSPDRVNRGGSWINSARICRSAYRDGSEPVNRYDSLGLRVLLVPGSRDQARSARQSSDKR